MKPVIIIAIAFVLLFIPISAFAQTDYITSKHWFITSYENGCSGDNQKSLEFYEKLTPQYLSKYDIRGSQDVGKCVRGIDVANNIEDFSSTLENYDLPIVILDGFKGLDYTLSTDAFGHYMFQDNQAVIIFSSLSPFVESDSGAWILSHELSHFALHEKKYSQSVFIDWVHQKQTEANTCLKNDLSLNNCPDLWTTVKSPLGKNIKMMTIYSSESESESTSELAKLLAELNNSPSQSSQTSSSQCLSYYVANQFRNAINCYNDYLQSNPSDIDALGFLGRTHEGKSEYISALKIFQEINGIEPNSTIGLNGIARSYDSLGQCEKAIPYYEKTLTIEPNNIEAKTFINLVSLVCQTGSPVSGSSFSVSKTYDIKPSLSNGMILSYKTDLGANSLILDVKMDTSNAGQLQLTLPRNLIDSQFGNNDDKFFVLVDGDEVKVNEVTQNSIERTIQFQVPSNSKQIEVIGTFVNSNAKVIPEFGSITMLILVTSIIVVIFSSRKFHVMK